MRTKRGFALFNRLVWPIAAALACCSLIFATGKSPAKAPQARIRDGQGIFRYDTFGDEAFWTDTLRMHEVIQDSLDPLTALSLGLKVDVDALPNELLAALGLVTK